MSLLGQGKGNGKKPENTGSNSQQSSQGPRSTGTDNGSNGSQDQKRQQLTTPSTQFPSLNNDEDEDIVGNLDALLQARKPVGQGLLNNARVQRNRLRFREELEGSLEQSTQLSLPQVSTGTQAESQSGNSVPGTPLALTRTLRNGGLGRIRHPLPAVLANASDAGNFGRGPALRSRSSSLTPTHASLESLNVSGTSNAGQDLLMGGRNSPKPEALPSVTQPRANLSSPLTNQPAQPARLGRPPFLVRPSLGTSPSLTENATLTPVNAGGMQTNPPLTAVPILSAPNAGMSQPKGRVRLPSLPDQPAQNPQLRDTRRQQLADYRKLFPNAGLSDEQILGMVQGTSANESSAQNNSQSSANTEFSFPVPAALESPKNNSALNPTAPAKKVETKLDFIANASETAPEDKSSKATKPKPRGKAFDVFGFQGDSLTKELILEGEKRKGYKKVSDPDSDQGSIEVNFDKNSDKGSDQECDISVSRPQSSDNGSTQEPDSNDVNSRRLGGVTFTPAHRLLTDQQQKQQKEDSEKEGLIQKRAADHARAREQKAANQNNGSSPQTVNLHGAGRGQNDKDKQFYRNARAFMDAVPGGVDAFRHIPSLFPPHQRRSSGEFDALDTQPSSMDNAGSEPDELTKLMQSVTRSDQQTTQGQQQPSNANASPMPLRQGTSPARSANASPFTPNAGPRSRGRGTSLVAGDSPIHSSVNRSPSRVPLNNGEEGQRRDSSARRDPQPVGDNSPTPHQNTVFTLK